MSAADLHDDLVPRRPCVPSALLSRYQDLLARFVAFRSVSADQDGRPEMRAAVSWLRRFFDGFASSVQVVEHDNGHPTVIATVDAGRDSTTMIYGHYDVQPVSAEQAWTVGNAGNLFALTARDGRLHGRGAADNKGQVLIHMVVAEALAKRGRLRSNVVFLIEGEEETGSRPLTTWLKQGGGPPADELLISDGCYPGDHPAIERSLRGGFNGRIRITTAGSDAHSGHAGGAIANAASVLAGVIAALIDERGVVTVPGFYDAVPALSDHADDPETIAALLSRFQVSELVLANAASYATQVTRYPTLQVSGITAGHTDKYANIVPATAVANLNGRLVAGQPPEEVWAAVVAAARRATPPFARLDGELEESLGAVELDPESAVARRAARTLELVLGRRPELFRGPGGLPALEALVARYGKGTVVSVGLANSDARPHGADENISLEAVTTGLAWSAAFLGRREPLG